MITPSDRDEVIARMAKGRRNSLKRTWRNNLSKNLPTIERLRQIEVEPTQEELTELIGLHREQIAVLQLFLSH